MAKYGKKAAKSVESAMRRRKQGTLSSGGSGRKVRSRKQAVAIGLSEAREKGARVPPRKSTKKRGGAKKGGTKKSGSTRRTGTAAKRSTSSSRKSTTAGSRKGAKKR